MLCWNGVDTKTVELDRLTTSQSQGQGWWVWQLHGVFLSLDPWLRFSTPPPQQTAILLLSVILNKPLSVPFSLSLSQTRTDGQIRTRMHTSTKENKKY